MMTFDGNKTGGGKHSANENTIYEDMRYNLKIKFGGEKMRKKLVCATREYKYKYI